MDHLALSARSLRERALTVPSDLAIASATERFTTLEFSELVNSLASTLSQIPKTSHFLPVLAATNINSVIAYHAAILSRTPVALIDGNINAAYLQRILEKLGNPKAVVISELAFAELLPSDLSVISVSRDRLENFDSQSVDLDSPAIVIFSSGSTGEPKGSVWNWRHIDEAWQVMVDYFPEREEPRVARVSSIAYAAGAYQMMSATLNHNLHLMDPKWSADEIIDFVNKNEIRQVSFSTSLVERIFDTKSPEKYFEYADDILTYGEAVSWEQIGKLRQLLRGDAIIRASYGASEAPGFLIYITVKPGDRLGHGRVPVGNIAGLKNVEFVPFGDDPEIKEIVIHHHVSLGYLDDPELTATKFFTSDSGEKSYRTGDLVRIDESGNINFVGRGDDLVKINGRLVGPSESEAKLRALPGIASVIVLPHQTKSGKSYLTAHLVLEPTSKLSPADVYEYLLSDLSSHLVPAQLVLHSALPLNENGKVDRKYLQSREWPRWKSEDSTEVPSIFETFALSQLRRILGTPDLTLTEDIFGSGMDSMAALEFEAIAAEFGYENIKPSIFLEYRTAKEIGKYISTGEPLQESNLVEINRGRLGKPLFIFPGAGVSAIFFKEFADELTGDRPVIVIEPRGLHTKQAIEQSIEEMAENAAADIAQSQPKGAIDIIGHSAGAANAVATALRLKSAGREVRVVSLDHISLTNNVAMSPLKYSMIAKWSRWSDLFTRSPKSIWRSLLRRKAALEKRPYEFFTLHIGGLGLKYTVPQKPTFPILFLYCNPRSRKRDWRNTSLYTYEKIAGTHFTMLNREHLPALISRITSFFH